MKTMTTSPDAAYKAEIDWIKKTTFDLYVDDTDSSWLRVPETCLNNVGVQLDRIGPDSRFDPERGDVYLATGGAADMFFGAISIDVPLETMNIRLVYDGPLSHVAGLENYAPWPVVDEIQGESRI